MSEPTIQDIGRRYRSRIERATKAAYRDAYFPLSYVVCPSYQHPMSGVPTAMAVNDTSIP